MTVALLLLAVLLAHLAFTASPLHTAVASTPGNAGHSASAAVSSTFETLRTLP